MSPSSGLPVNKTPLNAPSGVFLDFFIDSALSGFHFCAIYAWIPPLCVSESEFCDEAYEKHLECKYVLTAETVELRLGQHFTRVPRSRRSLSVCKTLSAHSKLEANQPIALLAYFRTGQWSKSVQPP